RAVKSKAMIRAGPPPDSSASGAPGPSKRGLGTRSTPGWDRSPAAMTSTVSVADRARARWRTKAPTQSSGVRGYEVVTRPIIGDRRRRRTQQGESAAQSLQEGPRQQEGEWADHAGDADARAPVGAIHRAHRHVDHAGVRCAQASQQ